MATAYLNDKEYMVNELQTIDTQIKNFNNLMQTKQIDIIKMNSAVEYIQEIWIMPNLKILL